MGWLLWVVRFRVFSAADQAPDHVKNGFEQAHDLCYDAEMKEAVRMIPAQLWALVEVKQVNVRFPRVCRRSL